jgi:hypothetical protein
MGVATGGLFNLNMGDKGSRCWPFRSTLSLAHAAIGFGTLSAGGASSTPWDQRLLSHSQRPLGDRGRLHLLEPLFGHRVSPTVPRASKRVKPCAFVVLIISGRAEPGCVPDDAAAATFAAISFLIFELILKLI